MDASERKPHIVMVGGTGDLSGVPRHICQLARALSDDVTITVISDRNEGGFDALATSSATHQLVHGIATPRGLLGAWSSFLQTLKETQADLIWLHAPYPAFFARLARALRLWRPSCPIVFTVHADSSSKGHPLIRRILFGSFEKLIMTLNPKLHIVFLSDKEKLRRGTKHVRHVLQNCANIGTLKCNRRTNTRHLIMTGRVSRQKDHHRALHLFQSLPDDMHLTLCGPGTNSDNFKNATAALLSKTTYDRISFVGPINDIRPHLACADAYVLTSRYEGQPIGALEAFEAGLPMILSNFEGASDLVKMHPCALLLKNDPFRDVARISALVNTFRQDEAALRTRTQAVWRQHWSPDVFAKNARALVQEVLNDAA